MDPHTNNDSQHRHRPSQQQRRRPTGIIPSDGRRNSTTYSVEAPPCIPSWVQSIVKEKTGTEGHCVQFVVSKPLTASDMDRNQNRFLLPKTSAETNIIPFLTDEERRLAGYDRSNANDANDGAKKGVDVKVYDKAGVEFSDVALAYWTSSGAWLINGRDYKLMRSRWRPHVRVEVWYFRTPRRSPTEQAEINLELTLGPPEQVVPTMDLTEERRSPVLNFIIG